MFLISRIRKVSLVIYSVGCDIHDYIFIKANFLAKILCHKIFELYGTT